MNDEAGMTKILAVESMGKFARRCDGVLDKAFEEREVDNVVLIEGYLFLSFAHSFFIRHSVIRH